jgi:hypothetical protein
VPVSTRDFVIYLTPQQAAGLKRFADKVTHSDAMAVLYPHVGRDLRSEQAYAIVGAFSAIEVALGEAGVNSWPWIETGQV